jgi:hypothetical protein
MHRTPCLRVPHCRPSTLGGETTIVPTVAGRIEVADKRGRFGVTAVRSRRRAASRAQAWARHLRAPADYYSISPFDSTLHLTSTTNFPALSAARARAISPVETCSRPRSVSPTWNCHVSAFRTDTLRPCGPVSRMRRICRACTPMSLPTGVRRECWCYIARGALSPIDRRSLSGYAFRPLVRVAVPLRERPSAR